MWTCSNCHHVNADDVGLCQQCSASRPSGRFDTASLRMGQAARAPRVAQAAQPAPESRAAAGRYTRSAPPIDDTYRPAPGRSPRPNVPPRPSSSSAYPDVQPPQKRPLIGFARFVGTMLCILLPLLSAALLILGYQSISSGIAGQFFAFITEEWIQIAVFALVGLLILLLSLLPGLRLLVMLPPKRKKKNDDA